MCFTVRAFTGDNFTSLKSMLPFWIFIYNNLRSTCFFKVILCSGFHSGLYYLLFNNLFYLAMFRRDVKLQNHWTISLNDLKVFLDLMKVGFSGRIIFVTFISFCLSWFFWKELASCGFLKGFFHFHFNCSSSLVSFCFPEFKNIPEIFSLILEFLSWQNFWMYEIQPAAC